MGRWTLTALVINSILGSGIFGLPSVVAARLGSASPLAYLLAAGVIAIIMGCFAEVASQFKEAGGPYLYTRVAFGRLMGMEVGWILWLSRLASAAAACNLFVAYLGFFWPASQQAFVRAILMGAVICILAAANIMGISTGARMSNAFTIAKLVPLLLFAVGGLIFIWNHPAAAPVAPVTPQAGDWLEAALVLIFAYGGFEAAVVPMSEARDPRRDAPFALGFGLVVVTAIYILVQIVVIRVLPNAASTDRPLALAAQHFAGSTGAALITLGALVSLFGYLSAQMLHTPRLTFALAEHKDFPALFSSIHPRFRTPYFSIIVFAGLLWPLSVAGSFRWNVLLSAVARLFTYGFVCASLPVLRRKHPAANAYRLPGGSILAVLGIAFMIVLVSRMHRGEFIVIAATILIAVANWYWARRRPLLR
jgi:APA family basic amino acid/polyamine antiporter